MIKLSTFFNSLNMLEEKIIFKFAHVYFWILISFSIVGFIASVLFLLYGISPVFKPGETPIRLPDAAKVTIEDIKIALKPPEPSPVVPTVETKAKPVHPEKKAQEVPEESPEMKLLAAKLDEIKELFPDPPYKWESTYKKGACISRSWGKCTAWAQIIDKKGMKETVNAIVNIYKTPAQKIVVLDEWKKILASMPVEDREDALRLYPKVRADKERQRNKLIRQLQAQVAAENRAKEVNYVKAKATRVTLLNLGRRGIGLSASAIAFFSIALILLSIERILRQTGGKGQFEKGRE